MATNREEKHELAEVVREVDPNFWARLNRGERDRLLKVLPQIVSFSVQRHSVFSGPIPQPEMLAEYDKIIPNGADRIMTMAENQSKHRQSIEKAVIGSQNKQGERGQIFAFVLALAFAAVGTWMGVLGHTGVAGTIFGVTVCGLVTTFVMGKSSQKKDLGEKAGEKKPSDQ